MQSIKNLLKRKKEEQITKNIENIENCKDDSNRMYNAVRNMYREKAKHIIVETEHGVTCNAAKATEAITQHFEKTFNNEDATKVPHIEPTKMKNPFTPQEVGKAIKKLKNNKSTGVDNISAEQLKYGPDIVNSYISDILNEVAETGEYPKELDTGILIPLQKPGKKKGPPGNLRPIILLTMIRKILAIIMLERTHKKIEEHIPHTQAAYRRGRSTTEQLFAVKMMVEKAMISEDYTVVILLMDMSKAFDTVGRAELLQKLSKILDKDELHMIRILITDVKLQVQYDNHTGRQFTTNVGVPQGDSFSPVLFTFYLSYALQYIEEVQTPEDHSYCKQEKLIEEPYSNIVPDHLHDHTYTPVQLGITIDMQYADDTGWVSTDKKVTDHIQATMPAKLKKYNLNINKDKTEEYTVHRNGSEEWKKCKYLGSLLGTEEDIKRRKSLAMDAFNHYKETLTNKRLSLNVRCRLFKSQISSIFLYNSELWTLNKKLDTTVDVFQRRLYRKILQVHWPRIIRNTDLYARVGDVPWSGKIRTRRLLLLGHLQRLHPETPARRALHERLRDLKRPRGGQKSNWVGVVNKDLKEKGLNTVGSEASLRESADRKFWRSRVL